jgi:hypothetical protein
MGTGAYTLTIFTDDVNPTISSLWPTSGMFLPSAQLEIQVSADDNQSGISHVEFWGYMDGWSIFDEDWDDSDGWQTTLDTSVMTEGDQIVIFAKVYDWAGNWVGIPAWDLTLDFSHPETTADPLPDPSESTAIHLNWSHDDNIAGIRSSHIRYRKNSETWQNQGFEEGTREWWFVGEAGNNYTFRIRAIDNAGNIEPYIEGAEASTSIPEITTLCSSPDSWDISSTINDNDLASATPLPTDWQSHNFCNPSTSDQLNDVDWFILNAVIDHTYVISALTSHSSTAVVIKVYDQDGITLLKEYTPSEFGDTSTILWQASQDGPVYIELSHLDGRIAGNAVGYQVSYQDTPNGIILYFPLIGK